MSHTQDLRYRIADAHKRRDELKAAHNVLAYEALSDPIKKEQADKLLDDVTVVLREIVHLESAQSGAAAQDQADVERRKDEAHAALKEAADAAITKSTDIAHAVVEALFTLDTVLAAYQAAHEAQQHAVQAVYDSAGLTNNQVADMAGWRIVRVPEELLTVMRDMKRVHHTWPNQARLLAEIPSNAGRLRGFVRQQKRGTKPQGGPWGAGF